MLELDFVPRLDSAVAVSFDALLVQALADLDAFEQLLLILMLKTGRRLFLLKLRSVLALRQDARRYVIVLRPCSSNSLCDQIWPECALCVGDAGKTLIELSFGSSVLRAGAMGTLDLRFCGLRVEPLVD